MITSGRINKLSKKEALDITKEHEKLSASVADKSMKGLPDALFVVDVNYEKIAVTEAKKMGIPIIALVDTTLILRVLTTLFQAMMMRYAQLN